VAPVRQVPLESQHPLHESAQLRGGAEQEETAARLTRLASSANREPAWKENRKALPGTTRTPSGIATNAPRGHRRSGGGTRR
jgi:hypothetical protein